MHVQPYLYFNGRTEEALNFYRDAIGAEIVCLMRFSESPDQSMISPGMSQKVMHSAFRLGDSELMASDGMCAEEKQGQFQGITLTIQVKEVPEAERLFNALAEGGAVQMPLAQTFFAERFGMVADQFGVGWLILANAK